MTRPRTALPPLLVGSATLAALLVLPACLDEADGKAEASDAAARRPVLLVCIDTLRADRLGCYGYDVRATSPNLDALAAEGWLFADASATAGWTKPSVPSYLTGRPPAEHGVYEGSARLKEGATSDRLHDSVWTLAESFASAGYDTAAFIRNAQLRPGQGLEQGFDVYRDEVGDAADIRRAALSWLDERAGDEDPFLLYLHVLDTHAPYDIPDLAATRFADEAAIAPFRADGWRDLRDALNDGARQLDDAEHEALAALYDASIHYVDAQLGLLLDDLAARGLEDELVVAVVSDHGEEFLEHGRLGHGHGLWENLLSVPWILRVPGAAPRVIDTPVATLDLPATLRAAAGLPSRPEPGRTNRLAEPARATPLFAEHKAPDAYEQSLREGSLKLVRRMRPGRPGAGIDERAGPGGLPVGGRWEADLITDVDERRPRVVELEPEPDEDERDELELKGHVGALGDGRVQVGPFEGWLDDDVDVSGLGGSLAEVGVGDPVKLVGRVDDDGRLRVRKLKRYPRADTLKLQLRATLRSIEADGDGSWLANLGGLSVRVDDRTDVDVEPGDSDTRLRREHVREALTRGGAACARAGWEVVSRLYDLDRDPGERAPLLELRGVPPDDSPAAALFQALDELGREHASRADWGESLVVDAAGLEALRQLGYVR